MRELSASQRAAHQEKAARDTLVAARRLCPEAAHDAPPDCLGVEVDLGRLDFIDSRWDAALGHLKPVLPELAAKAAGTEDQAAAYELLASLHASRNETDQALKHFEQAIAIRESMWGKNSARIAQTHLRFGRTLWTLRQLSQAEAELEKAWRISSTTLGPKHVLSARIEANLGRLQFYLGISPEGLPHLEHARQALHRQRSRIDPIEIFQVQVLWANALVLDGHLARARDELAEAMNLHSRLKTHAGPDVTLDVSQARWLIDTGQFAEGRQILERLRDSAIARSGPKHPDVADRRSRLAQAWLASGEPIRAEAELAAAMDTQDAAETQFGSPQHRAQLVLLALRLAQGRYDLAATLATSLEQGAQKTPRREQLREALVQMHSAVGRTWAGTGRHADADVHLVKAIELLDAANPDHPGLVELRAYRAQNLAATHGGARACEELARAQTLLAKLPMLGPQFRGAVLDAQSRIRCARAPLLAARSMSLDPNGPTANR
ncbi:MAG TPA: tetratricopeptide repeat protein [Ideonella sp.]|uniref:tetratricopeptide repeat protein n=1 Tax=Ideonella sp. TaxID=1929293 RepID=UPI002E353731|nr:tetratricopeptide repeat protein [Ideonella sp.]HEX5688284.1 tetratricopeptide repeat protein [Ideonella sp.]